MTRKMVLVPIIACLGIGMLLLAIASLAGTEHADSKHSEAALVRSCVRQGLCQQKEVWFAPTSGRVLFLCQLEGQNNDLWAGWVVFVAANHGTELIDPCEATVFVSSEWYWRDKIKRDRYEMGFLYPRIVDHATDVLGIP